MGQKVPCPRCGQDWVVRVELIALERVAAFCPECEALWLDERAVGSTGFIDYGTFLRESGRPFPDRAGELRVLGPLELDPPSDG